MTVLLNLKRLGKKFGSKEFFIFTAADVVGPTSQEAVARTGNIHSALMIGSRTESRFGCRGYRSRTLHDPSPKGTAVGRLTRRRGGQRHDRTQGD